MLLAAWLAVFLVLLAMPAGRVRGRACPDPDSSGQGLVGARPVRAAGRRPLNPMSVTLSALAIAISTEFSVLLSARYRVRARRAAPGRRGRCERTYSSTGAAVLASGATAIAGFGALIASDIRMLRDFGIVTVADLTVSLLGVMLVLPAALLWAEEHGPFSLADLDPRPLVREAWAARPSLRLPRPRLRALRRRSGA